MCFYIYKLLALPSDFTRAGMKWMHDDEKWPLSFSVPLTTCKKCHDDRLRR